MRYDKAIAVGDSESTSAKILRMITSDSVPMDTSYKGPMPEYDESSKRYTPTKEFVEGMIQLFKDGGKLPKRLCWEIVLGCKEALDKENSLVEVNIGKGVKCDIVGDTHGVSPGGAEFVADDIADIILPCAHQQFYDLCNLLNMLTPPSETHAILFNGTDFLLQFHYGHIRLSVHSGCFRRRFRRPWLVVCGSRAYPLCLQVAIPIAYFPESWKPRDER